MKIYIAGHNRSEASRTATTLQELGHEITSTWVCDEGYRTQRSREEKQLVATREIEEVLRSDLLVSLAADDNVPGGKHVELGVALGNGIRCLQLGRIENIFHFHPLVTVVATMDELVEHIVG